MISRSGMTPLVKDGDDSGEVLSLDKILEKSSGPVVVFPEVRICSLESPVGMLGRKGRLLTVFSASLYFSLYLPFSARNV